MYCCWPNWLLNNTGWKWKGDNSGLRRRVYQRNPQRPHIIQCNWHCLTRQDIAWNRKRNRMCLSYGISLVYQWSAIPAVSSSELPAEREHSLGQGAAKKIKPFAEWDSRVGLGAGVVIGAVLSVQNGSACIVRGDDPKHALLHDKVQRLLVCDDWQVSEHSISSNHGTLFRPLPENHWHAVGHQQRC